MDGKICMAIVATCAIILVTGGALMYAVFTQPENNSKEESDRNIETTADTAVSTTYIPPSPAPRDHLPTTYSYSNSIDTTTTDTTTRPEYISPGPECERLAYYIPYYGNQRVTASNATCLRWEELPVSLAIYRDVTQFPDQSLEEASNKCRNPNVDLNGAWCFTFEGRALNREYCGIRSCRDDEDVDDCEPNPCRHGGTCTDHGLRNFTCECAPHFKGIFCEAAYGEDGCLAHGSQYTGNVTHTALGFPCLTWTTVLQSVEFESYWDESQFLNPDILRNLTETDHHCKYMITSPWKTDCFAFVHQVVSIMPCNVHFCHDFEPENDCFIDNLMYKGNRTFNARDGRPCISWHFGFISLLSAHPAHHDILSHAHYFPEDDMHSIESKCRNPEDDPNGPWCFTLRNYKTEIALMIVEFMSCGIPECPRDAQGDVISGVCRHDNVVCRHGGTCEHLDGDPVVCHCREGFYGRFCESAEESRTGAGYAGGVSYDEWGRPCMNWRAINDAVNLFPDASIFPDDTIAEAAYSCRILPDISEELGVHPDEAFCLVWNDQHAYASPCRVPKYIQNVCDYWLISPVKYRVSDASFTSSSHVEGFESHMSRISSSGWSAQQNDFGSWIKVDLEKVAAIHKITTLGEQDAAEWVIEYSIDGLHPFQFITDDDDNAAIFRGNNDSSTRVTNTLDEQLIARYVVLYPLSWQHRASLRWELIGCAPIVRQPGYQSSTANGFDAARAIDGDVNTGFEAASCSLTGNELRAWWTVDLGSLRRVYQVVIFNRNDSQGESLRRFHIWLLNDTHNPLSAAEKSLCTYRSIQVPTRSTGYTIRCDAPTVGRYLSIQQHAFHNVLGNSILSTDPLSLCEVLVIDEEQPFPCKRPSDGFYNGDVAGGNNGVCLKWKDVFFSGEYPVPPTLGIFGDIRAFSGENSWNELGHKCRNPSYHAEGPHCFYMHGVTLGIQKCHVDDCSDNCTPNPCFNEGTCTLNNENHVVCLCVQGYFGSYCESADCMEEGEVFSGDLNINGRGFPCLNWLLVVENIDIGLEFSLSRFPDTSWQALGNKCRLVEEISSTPGCLVVFNTELIWESCFLPACSQVDLQHCMDARGHYTGSVTGSVQCADWRILYEEYQWHPTYEDMLGLHNFPAGSWEMVGNKCRNPIDNLRGPFCMRADLSVVACDGILSQCADPCDPDPCMNEATCITNWHSMTSSCACAVGYSGRYCESGDCRTEGAAYAGNVSVEAQGRRCRPWHIYQGMLGYDLSDFPNPDWQTVSNKCRDPFGTGIPNCLTYNFNDNNELYITGSDCYVLLCSGNTAPDGADVECHRESRIYTGSHTESRCLSWQEVFEISEFHFYAFPEESWEQVGRYCRNPDFDGAGPWCSALVDGEIIKHYCTVPLCEEGDDCTPNPCLNGGVCIDGYNSWMCECSGGYHGVICESNECIGSEGDYDGALSVSISGKRCLQWSLVLEVSRVLYDHTDIFRDLDESEPGLANKCRVVNTITVGLSPACAVYDNALFTLEECNIPFCQGFEPEDCAHLVHGNYWYNGNISTTQTGRRCVDWQSIRDNPAFSPYGHLDLFPDETWDILANKCRNPNGRSFMWCFTDATDPDSIEICHVPRCGTVMDGDECEFQPCLNEATCVDGQHSFECLCHDGYYGFLCESSGCRQGIMYNGNVSVSQMGLPCLKWESLQYLEDYSLNLFDFQAESSWEGIGNKCRNPDGDERGPWCLVFYNQELTKDYCNIAPCE